MKNKQNNRIEKSSIKVAHQVWNMLPDECKNIIGKAKESFINSISTDISFEINKSIRIRKVYINEINNSINNKIIKTKCDQKLKKLKLQLKS
jgi:hypothetical protein